MAREQAGHATWLPQRNTGLARTGSQQGIEIRAPDLEPAPRSAGVAAEWFEPAGSAPLDPDAGVPCTDHHRQPVGGAKLRQQRLNCRMQRFARPVSAWRFALAQHDTQASPGAGNRGGAARRPAANDNYVGIERSVVHEPLSWRSSTVFSDA